MRRKLHAILVAVLFTSLLSGITVATMVPAIAAACTSSQFTVTQVSNPTFYVVNTGSTASGYAAFKVTNHGSSGNYWAGISFPNQTNITRASGEVNYHALGNLAPNASAYAYFYLTADSVTNGNSTNSSTVTIYSAAAGSGAVCDYTVNFKIASTIKASANKLTSVTNGSLPSIGGTFTVTVVGKTGTIGAGPSGNRDININPATSNSWPASSYELTDVSLAVTGCATSSYLHVLWIRNACAGTYTAVFTFKYNSVPGTAAAVSPKMQIASGTQMKHTTDPPSGMITNIGGTPAAYSNTTNATSITSSAATLNGTLVSVSGTTLSNAIFCYSTSNPGTHFTVPCTTSVVGNVSSGNVTATITGLSAGTKYYFEIFADTSSTATNTYPGTVQTFVALNSLTTTTSAVSSITQSTATFAGTSTADLASTGSFFVFDTTNPGSNFDPSLYDTNLTGSASSPYRSWSLSQTGLLPGKTYYVEFIGVDSSGAQYPGGVVSFTTTAAAITATFNPNGGTLASGNATDTVGISSSSDDWLFFAPTPDPTRFGYTFDGWALQSASTVVLTTYTSSTSATLVAVWTLNSGQTTYSVTYNNLSSNNTAVTSGSAPTDSGSPYVGGSTVVALTNSGNLALTNYSFSGWCTTNNNADPSTCSGGTIAAGSNVTTNIAGALNLYAVWVAAYTVTYNYNGATSDSSTVSSIFTSGNPITLPTPKKTGYAFSGWYSDAGLSSSIGAGGASYSPGATGNAYAKWTANTDNGITYNNQSATTAHSGGSTTYTTASAIATIPTTAPLKTGYTFAGWFSAATSGTQITNGSYTPLLLMTPSLSMPSGLPIPTTLHMTIRVQRLLIRAVPAPTQRDRLLPLFRLLLL